MTLVLHPFYILLYQTEVLRRYIFLIELIGFINKKRANVAKNEK
ncbi:hypothetical protein C2W59_01611 [Bacillus pumilus]|nr:hypothetical protein C2W59_01611 [Bacillus pumilus]